MEPDWMSQLLLANRTDSQPPGKSVSIKEALKAARFWAIVEQNGG
jgi:hypothetical protein